MAPWTTLDFPPLAPSSTRQTRPIYQPPGSARRSGGSYQGRSPGTTTPPPRGGGGIVVEREKVMRAQAQAHDEPNPFVEMTEKFDGLNVVVKKDDLCGKFEMGKNTNPPPSHGGGKVVVVTRSSNKPNPSDEKISENFDGLSLVVKKVEGNFEVGENGGGINFDAYEDIPVEATGENVPCGVNSFAEIDLGEGLNENIRRCKYVKPTPIQRHAIPISMAGRDLMACAQTGSGKTAAFCFPIIAGILKRGRLPPRGGRTSFPAALILSPTRELSSQIHDEAKKFAYDTGVKVVVAYGGAPITDQLRMLERGVDILVATPGRLVDMIERGIVSLRMIKYLALDEADRMLDMGFEPQIRKIVQKSDMPPTGSRQTMLFSATFPTEIQRLASDFLSNYIFLSVGRVGSSTDLIAQKVEFVHDMDKKKHLMDLLVSQTNGTNGKHALTIVFAETKRGVDDLAYWLSCNGFPATAIHGDKVQMERERALRSFKTGNTPIMVATDVAARGLDIPMVAHVINFDLPRDIDDYVHRIGRTGRAGKSGLATAFFNNKNVPIAKALVELMEEANQEVPSWLTDYAQNSSTHGFGGSNRRSRGGGGTRFGGRDYRSFDYGAANNSSQYGGGAQSGYGSSQYDGGMVQRGYGSSPYEGGVQSGYGSRPYDGGGVQSGYGSNLYDGGGVQSGYGSSLYSGVDQFVGTTASSLTSCVNDPGGMLARVAEPVGATGWE